MTIQLAAGTVVILMKGKAEDRWQLTGDYYPARSDVHTLAVYAARRWIKKNAKWSSNAYLIAATRIVRVEN